MRLALRDRSAKTVGDLGDASLDLLRGQCDHLDHGDRAGLGWDEVKQKHGLFGFKAAEIDCDASASEVNQFNRIKLMLAQAKKNIGEKY